MTYRQDLLTDVLVQIFLSLILSLILVLTGSPAVAVYLILALIVLVGGFVMRHDHFITTEDERDFHLVRWGTLFVVAVTGLSMFAMQGLPGNVLVGSGMVLYSFIAAADHTYEVGWEDGLTAQPADDSDASEDE